MDDSSQQRAADRLVYTFAVVALAVFIEMLVIDFVRLPSAVDLFLLIANTPVVIFMEREVERSFRNMRQASSSRLFATYQLAGGLALGCAVFSFIVVAVLAWNLPIILSRL